MTVRATVQLPKLSGIPGDTINHDFHFGAAATPDPVGATFDTIAGWISRFYNEPNPTIGGMALCAFLSQTLSRAADAVKVVFHHRPVVVPDNAIATRMITLQSNAVTDAYADEVACVLSYNDGSSSAHPRRHRGRLYFGPLSTAGIATGLTTVPRPSANLIDGLADAASRLEDDSSLGLAGLWQWSVWSSVDGAAYHSNQGFIDNALDTQRRRGPKATARTPWS